MMRPRRGETRISFKIAGILFSILTPTIVIILTLPTPKIPTLIGFTALGCVIAMIVALFMVEGVTRYPGVEVTTPILPAFSAAYGLLLLTLILSRLDYSRGLLVGSYVFANLWFYLVYSRRINMRIGLVPGGIDAMMTTSADFTWVVLETPDADVSTLDAVTADLRQEFSEDWERRMADYALAGLPVYHSKHLAESLTGRVDLEHLSENSFGTLSPASRYMFVKHIVDWIAALLALIALSPALAAIALLVRLDSAGPVIFRQTRIGYRGKPFIIYKFRSMAMTAGSPLDGRHDAITQEGDLRVSRFGRFIRRTRIDELPQLLNILKGEMSWIGPRPEAGVLSQWYENEIPFYRYRHIVRPGITGWAQVNQGHVAEIDDVKSKLDYDFYYIKHFSPVIDLLIMFRTVITMLTGFGAR